ncbi:hypothetical protein CEP54_011917 [Fusarium duplospermum]|uniref:Uncharacterized protein n=1 Tax=Fusarium duplospermum TaxID=1325734 RepID=A0A428PBJ2_9HYPO|nr:hypothetical protein CEP54_011917 [Fusarium duplospermum]
MELRTGSSYRWMEMKRPPLDPICVLYRPGLEQHPWMNQMSSQQHDTTSTKRPFNSGRGICRHPSPPPTPQPKTAMNTSYYSHFPISSSPNPMLRANYCTVPSTLLRFDAAAGNLWLNLPRPTKAGRVIPGSRGLKQEARS